MRMFLGTEEEKEYLKKMLAYNRTLDDNITHEEREKLLDEFAKNNMSKELWNARQEYIEEREQIYIEAEAKGQMVLVD